MAGGIAEALILGSAPAQELRSQLVHARGADLLEGALSAEELRHGWVRPTRFREAQIRALTSCVAWYPGIYRQMARATAGVCLRFATDACEMALAVRMDDEPQATRAVLAELDERGRAHAHDGISVTVDGRRLGVVEPHRLSRMPPWLEGPVGMGLACADLRKASRRLRVEAMTIPGLGERHEVEVWLPALRGCEIGLLWTDGTFVEPLRKRSRLLVLGDSIGQGFVCEDPAQAWPVRLAQRLGCELLNQSVGGQVFQASALVGLGDVDASYVVVELGGNYRWGACAPQAVAREVRAYLNEVRRAWPLAPTLVVGPLWHDEERSPSHADSCWSAVAGIMEEVVGEVGATSHDAPVTFVDGRWLLGDDATLFADAEHPNAKGHARMAQRLARMLPRREDRA